MLLQHYRLCYNYDRLCECGTLAFLALETEVYRICGDAVAEASVSHSALARLCPSHILHVLTS